jgi:hypothetical protein
MARHSGGEALSTQPTSRGGRPPMPPEERRCRPLWTYVTEAEEAEAMRLAQHYGESLSWYLRRVILRAIEAEQVPHKEKPHPS